MKPGNDGYCMNRGKPGIGGIPIALKGGGMMVGTPSAEGEEDSFEKNSKGRGGNFTSNEKGNLPPLKKNGNQLVPSRTR